MQKMKARADKQGFDLIGSSSKSRPEAVDRLGDSSNKRLKVAVHTTLPPKEEMTTVDAAEGFSTSDKDRRAAMLKSRYADTIFKAQQEAKAVDSMQKMKTSVDTQVSDLKKSVGSKPRPEAADCFGDSSNKRTKVVVHSTSIPQCPTMRKEEMGAPRFSTSDKDLRVSLLKSRFADTIFKAQQELKASVDIQGFDLKNSVGSKRRPETVDRVGDSSKKRPKVAVHTTSTSGKDPSSAMLKSSFADPILKDKAQQEMEAVKTLHPTPTIQRKREKVEAVEPMAHVDFQQPRDGDRRAARIALEKMTNTAGIELNLDVQRDFDILVGSSSVYY
ncbi:hypothetical protein V6N13_050646 [Hibiscus sabdariffa]|uniref:Uncharacterized protein n=1 Tax=Hibiscus sabdariffa TaxID=183260 RepID=A0ABR2PHX7_9ROSI